jgi:hypothetical protein
LFWFPEFLLEIFLDIFPKMLWIMIAYPITYLLIYRNSCFCIKLKNSRLVTGDVFFIWYTIPICIVKLLLKFTHTL